MEVELVIDNPEFEEQYIEFFNGNSLESHAWAYNKIQEFLDYFPKYARLITEVDEPIGKRYAIIIRAEKPFNNFKIGAFFYE